MKNSIVTLSELEAKGFKLAFIDENRAIDEKNVKAKMDSMSKFGGNITPIDCVLGEKAASEGCTLIDAFSTAKVADPSKYVVVFDGQHRSIAYANLRREKRNVELRLYVCPMEATTKDLLAESNSVGKQWNTNDWLYGSHTFHPKNDAVSYAYNELSKKRGMKLASISLFLTFGGSLNDKALKTFYNTGSFPQMMTPNVERCKLILSTLDDVFGDYPKFIISRYPIVPIITLVKDGFKVEDVCEAIQKLDKSIVVNVAGDKSHKESSGILYDAIKAILKKAKE